MKNILPKLKANICWLTLALSLTCASTARGVTYYYFSGGGANGNWSTAANWSVNGVPPANNTNIGIVFLSGANNKTSIVDIAGISTRLLEFLQVSNHVVSSSVARTLTLIGQGPTNPVVRMVLPSNHHYGRFRFDSNIELVVSNTCLFKKDYADHYSSHYGPLTNDTLVIAGRISGPGSVRFDQRTTFNSCDVILQGSNGNTYTGATAVADDVTVYLDKSAGLAVPGNLHLESSWTDVIWLRDNQVSNTAVITNKGSLRLNSRNDTVGNLHLLDESLVVTATNGLLTLGGDVQVESGTVEMRGRVALGTPSDSRVGRQFIVQGTQQLWMYASISGSAILRKVGTGTLFLVNSNSYTGLTALVAGTTTVNRSNALGSVSGGTYIGGSAMLSFDGYVAPGHAVNMLTCAEPLEIAAQGTNAPHAYHNAVQAINLDELTLTGPIYLNGEARFYEDAGGGLKIHGPVQGPGRFRASAVKGGIYFAGTATNTLSGGMWVEYGALYLQRSGVGRSIPGELAIAGTVYADWADQFGLNSWVAVSNIGKLNIRSNQSIASLEGTGQVWVGPVLTVGASGSNSVFSGRLANYWSGIGGGLTKVGSGTLTLLGTNSCTGSTIISGGQYLVHGAATSSPITLNLTATLGGTGIVSQIGGTGGLISPGPGKAALQSGSLSLNAGHTLALELGGTNSGVNADVLRVTGAVNLANTALGLTLTAAGKAGAQYLLLDNDGADAVVGTFNGLPEGATLTVNGILFQISYNGGTGNDVVITQLMHPPQPTIGGIQKLPGGQMLIQGAGLPGVGYQVQATISLIPPAWVTIGSLDAHHLSGLIEFTDPGAVGLPMRFYRLAIP
jgi:fibronectin-binding autotransporter adhesin